MAEVEGNTLNKPVIALSAKGHALYAGTLREALAWAISFYAHGIDIDADGKVTHQGKHVATIVPACEDEGSKP